jgi:hypothetical protein
MLLVVASMVFLEVYINASSLASSWTVFDGRLSGQKREEGCAQGRDSIVESIK